MREENARLLRSELPRVAGVDRGAVGDGWVKALGAFLEAVREWNQRVNLTGITEEREMVIKHVLDSATVLGAVGLADGQRLLDVGTGAGFPGVVLKVLRPGVHVGLLESLQKRCEFLRHVRRLLMDVGVPGCAEGLEVMCGRAEDWGRREGYRESFDVVVARAVAEMRVLAEYCLPFCRVGGAFVAMKGPGAETELAAAEEALRRLGGAVEKVVAVSLPEGAGERRLVVVRKVSATPSAYPRKAGTPERRPL